MSPFTIIWIDSEETRLFNFGGGRMERRQIPTQFSQVAPELNQSREIMIVGPGTTPTEFARYLGAHLPEVRNRVVQILTDDELSDAKLTQWALRYALGGQAS